MLNGLLKKFGLPFSHHDRYEDDFCVNYQIKTKKSRKMIYFFPQIA